MAKKEVEKLKKIIEPLLLKEDKTAILIVGIHIERKLLDIIKKTFPCREEAKNEFITDKNMSFFQRIQWAYRLGIIEKDFYEALDLFRNVRNKFVHDIDSDEFTDEDLSAMVKKLDSVYTSASFNGVRGYYCMGSKQGVPKSDFLTFSAYIYKKLDEFSTFSCRRGLITDSPIKLMN